MVQPSSNSLPCGPQPLPHCKFPSEASPTFQPTGFPLETTDSTSLPAAAPARRESVQKRKYQRATGSAAQKASLGSGSAGNGGVPSRKVVRTGKKERKKMPSETGRSGASVPTKRRGPRVRGGPMEGLFGKLWYVHVLAIVYVIGTHWPSQLSGDGIGCALRVALKSWSFWCLVYFHWDGVLY